MLPWDGWSPMISQGEDSTWPTGNGRDGVVPEVANVKTYPGAAQGAGLHMTLTSSLMDGHQNCCWRKSRVRAFPGWHIKGDS